MIKVQESDVPCLVMTVEVNHFGFELSVQLRGGRLLVAGTCEGVLIVSRDSLGLSEKLGGDTHHHRALRSSSIHLGIDVDAMHHRNVLHMFQASDDLDIFGPRGDRMRSLIESLQTAATESIDGSATSRHI